LERKKQMKQFTIEHKEMCIEFLIYAKKRDMIKGALAKYKHVIEKPCCEVFPFKAKPRIAFSSKIYLEEKTLHAGMISKLIWEAIHYATYKVGIRMSDVISEEIGDYLDEFNCQFWVEYYKDEKDEDD